VQYFLLFKSMSIASIPSGQCHGGKHTESHKELQMCTNSNTFPYLVQVPILSPAPSSTSRVAGFRKQCEGSLRMVTR